jgi:ELWxxDGT repeat protein
MKLFIFIKLLGLKLNALKARAFSYSFLFLLIEISPIFTTAQAENWRDLYTEFQDPSLNEFIIRETATNKNFIAFNGYANNHQESLWFNDGTRKGLIQAYAPLYNEYGAVDFTPMAFIKNLLLVKVSGQGIVTTDNFGISYTPLVDSPSLYISNFPTIKIKGKLLIPTRDDDQFLEYSLSDGTSRGTKPFYKSDKQNAVSFTDDFIALGDAVFFEGCTVQYGCEPWYTDGTAKNTFMIADIAPGESSSYMEYFVRVGDHVVFRAAAVGTIYDFDSLYAYNIKNKEFFRISDKGTNITLIKGGSKAGSGAVFLAYSSHTNENGVVIIDSSLNFNFLSLVQYGGYDRNDGKYAVDLCSTDKYAFFMSGNYHLDYKEDPNLPENYEHYRLWRSDGTVQGTIEIKPGASESGFAWLMGCDNKRAFALAPQSMRPNNDINEPTEYKTKIYNISGDNSVETNTILHILQYVRQGKVKAYIPSKNITFFEIPGSLDSTWITDGTADGTHMLTKATSTANGKLTIDTLEAPTVKKGVKGKVKFTLPEDVDLNGANLKITNRRTRKVTFYQFKSRSITLTLKKGDYAASLLIKNVSLKFKKVKSVKLKMK